MKGLVMKTPPIVSAAEWDAARADLLVKEKEVMRARDALAAERRRMPWLAVRARLPLRHARRREEPRRPVRRSHAADRLPRVPRARCARLARARVRRLLDGRRPGRASRAPPRARHHRSCSRRAHRRPTSSGSRRAWAGSTSPGSRCSTTSTRTSASTSGTAPTRSSATATRCTAPTSSTTAATSRWATPGTTSTSPRSVVRRRGRTPPRATRRTEPYQWWIWHDEPTTDGHRPGAEQLEIAKASGLEYVQE